MCAHLKLLYAMCTPNDSCISVSTSPGDCCFDIFTYVHACLIAVFLIILFTDDILSYLCTDDFTVVFLPLCLTETSPLLPGVESSGETISLSQLLMSDRRDTATLCEQEAEDGASNDKNSAKSEDSASSFEELELELGRGQEDKDGPPVAEATGVTPDLLTNEQSAVGEEEEE